MGFPFYRMIEPGAKLHPIEVLPFYGVAFAFFLASLSATATNSWGEEIFNLWSINTALQLGLFTLVVQIPTYVTGHMSYVDIGWPIGLCVLSLTSLFLGSGLPARKYVVTICLLLHGSRMALGALAMLYPYKWKEDLSRYVYARVRWGEHTGRPDLWFVKQQHDTLMQGKAIFSCAIRVVVVQLNAEPNKLNTNSTIAFSLSHSISSAYANSVTLAGPIILAATNPNPNLHPLEILGCVSWVVCFYLENTADLQKNAFVKAAKRAKDIKTTVLGYNSYGGEKYWLWTLCRHPNYFFEWMCWNSFILMGLPSLIDLCSVEGGQNLGTRIAFPLLFLQLSRFFYDCLLYWTGAEPAESRSVERRPMYREYQKITRVFFPFWVPFFDHHQTPGWPNVGDKKKS
jgi:steroid 5-alpha reductase family enzyme